MGKVIVVTSGKGGVGKTTTCANLGVALALEQRAVALVDADIGLRNLDVVMGLESRVVWDLVDAAQGTCRLKQALVADPRFPMLSLLPAAQTRDKAALMPEDMRRIIRELQPQFDFILIDCPAGIEQGFQNAIAGAEEAVVVTNPEISAVHDADRVIGLLAASGLPAPKLIVNRVRPAMVRRGDMMTVEDVKELLQAELLGVVSDDEAIIRSGNLGEPAVTGQTPAALAYRDIARRLLGEDVPFTHTYRRARRWLPFLGFARAGAGNGGIAP